MPTWLILGEVKVGLQLGRATIGRSIVWHPLRDRCTQQWLHGRECSPIKQCRILTLFELESVASLESPLLPGQLSFHASCDERDDGHSSLRSRCTIARHCWHS